MIATKSVFADVKATKTAKYARVCAKGKTKSDHVTERDDGKRRDGSYRQNNYGMGRYSLGSEESLSSECSLQTRMSGHTEEW
jgi:hypothetical protein